MTLKKIIFLIASIIILLFSLSFSFSYSHYISEFSMNSPNLKENHSSTFTLNSDAELYFKYSAKNLTSNSSISLINDDTEEVIFSYGDSDNSEIILTDIPAGKYRFIIKYTDGFMSYKILTKKK
ncbi:MAG: hypothetical protein JEZ08_19920 [Clostridiales bacterium]|nr:hypothetical protein [Clostridiales bacterium]